MKRWTWFLIPLAGAVVVLAVLPSPTEAGPFRRRARPPVVYCQPIVCCPTPAAAPLPTPAVRTATSPSGKAYRLITRGLPEKPETDVDVTVFGASAGPDVFKGTSRRAAKTSYVEGVAPETFTAISALRATLVPEAQMQALNIPWGSGSQDSDRTDPEKRNVVVTAYIYAFKKETDNDYHVIIGDAPGAPGTQYLNSEVSGLPQQEGPQRQKLQGVRTKFKSEFGIGSSGPATYEEPEQPVKVRISGSLFYDMDHSPPRDYVGTGDYQPMIAWEIHPITAIEFLND
jgi:hypothetical protein